MMLKKPNPLTGDESVVGIFGFIKDIERYLKTGEFVNHPVAYHSVLFKRSRDYSVNPIKKIYSELSCRLYTFSDIMFFYVYNDMMLIENSTRSINVKNIKSIKSKFSNDTIKHDMVILNMIIQETGMTELDFFKVEESGENLLYNFVINEKISPATYITLWRKNLCSLKSFDILCQEMERFHNRIKILAYIIDQQQKGVSNGYQQ